MRHSYMYRIILFSFVVAILQHPYWSRVTHICDRKLTIISLDNIVAWSAPSHYLNQCLNIVISNHRGNFQWYLQRHSYIFIQENAFEKWRQFRLSFNVLSQCNSLPQLDHPDITATGVIQEITPWWHISGLFWDLVCKIHFGLGIFHKH